MKKQSLWNKIGTFATGKGFYMALVLCLAAIGVSGWYLWQAFHTAADLSNAEVSGAAEVTVQDEQEPAAGTAEVETEDPEAAAAEEEEPAPAAAETEPASVPEEAEETVGAVAEEDVTETTAPVETVPEETMAWIRPVEGEVVAAFSADTLTYNEAMGDWRTHEGVDLAAGIGDEVKAACGGTVLQVEQDVLLGWTVTVDCGDGITACYANLAEDCPLTPGQTIAAGDVIGAVGDTAAGEASGVAWLHFAVEKDGQSMDPMELIAAQ